jgi:AAA+ superfamily predicted ATPase
MATAEHIKALIRFGQTEDKERFYTTALQVAAYEARQGHSSLAHEIKKLVSADRVNVQSRLNVVDFPKELSGLVLTLNPTIPKSALVMDNDRSCRIDRIFSEYKQRSKLRLHGLENRRKLLFVGPPGTGKTLTAKVIAFELNLPLNIVQIDRLITKFMGETSAKLRLIFDLIKKSPGVYLFDEFDAIGTERTSKSDVGEIKRVLNAFLQFIEQDDSDSFIVAATNNPQVLDHALFRRFDDVLTYENPSEIERKKLISNIASNFLKGRVLWSKILLESEGLSYAEINHACKDAIKESILSDSDGINSTQLITEIRRRKSYKF